MAKLKSERHHWWPECVSEHWVDTQGGVYWLLPNGEVRRSSPENFGVIGNGHHIKLNNDPAVESPWDQSFEREFDHADSNFPRVLEWLNMLNRHDPPFTGTPRSRMMAQGVTDEMFGLLIECIVSLAVRSPMHRERAVSLAEHYRGPLPSHERNRLIGINMRNSQREAVKAIGGRGKALVIFSPDREFIFGDGFFHNLQPPVQHFHNPRILAPLTPWLAVLFTRPMRYTVEPRLVTLMATPEETDALNIAIQAYARNAIFYRSEQPAVTEHFACGKHLRFADDHNSVDQLIRTIPGISSGDTSLAAFQGLIHSG